VACGITLVSATEIIPGVWLAQGYVCCVPASKYVDLDIMADIGDVQTSCTPSDNPHPVDQETTVTGLSFGYPSEGPLDAIVFLSEYPKRCCLTNGVSTLVAYGVFNGESSSRTLQYSDAISDITYGGKAAFINAIPGDADCTLVSSLVMTIEDCSCSSSGG